MMKREGQATPPLRNKCGKLDESFNSGLPSMAYLELTPICNNNCVGCPNAMFTSSLNPRRIKPDYQCNYLKGTQWKSVINELSQTVSAVNLTGGETTLHPDFEEIVSYLDACGIDFVIFTNGRWSKPQQLISLLKRLKHFKGFLLSIHGASAFSHELFTKVTGSFDDAMKNVRLAIENNLWVTISTVITKANCNELDKVVQLATDLHADEISFNRFLIPNLPEESLSTFDLCPSSVELKNAILMIESMKEKYSDVLPISYGPCIPQCFAESSSKGCSAGEEFFVIDPLGNVKPCTDTTLICGNILANSLEEIWLSKEMEYWRSLSNTTCNSCSVLSICKTGCKAMALASGLQRDPLMVKANQFMSLPVINS